jgi:hypothetical protein
LTITTGNATAALVSMALALGATPAVAKPFDVNANGSFVLATSPSISSQPTKPTAAHATGPTIVRITARDTGFDWGDAGIGAAGGLALSLIALGGGLAVSQRRGRHTTA